MVLQFLLQVSTLPQPDKHYNGLQLKSSTQKTELIKLNAPHTDLFNRRITFHVYFSISL